jgi:colicin import membrane protein
MQSQSAKTLLSQESDIPRRRLFLFGVLSVMLHVVILTTFFLIPELSASKRFSPSVVKVSLVSLPPQGKPAPVSQAPAPKAAQPKAPTQRSPQPPSSTEKVSVAEPVQKKPKTSLKHRTYKADKVLQSQISHLAEKVEETRHPSIAGALDRLKREVEQMDANPRSRPDEQVADSGDRSAGRAGLGSGTATADEQQRLRIYQAEIAYQIQKNWAFSEQIAGGRTDLEAALGIKILADGEIKEIWFDQRSGNRHLDDSAYRAVVKSSPLPPLPRGLFQDHYIVGLKFGPKGLKRQ